jgi:primosomal protein DnaI
MEIRKININTDKIKESKKRVKEELIDNPFIIKKMKELNVSDEEFDTYLGYFQTYLEDKMMCSKCKNPKKCSKQFEGIAMDLYRSEYGIERSFSLCPPRELERLVAKKYLLRDFPDAYLGIVLDDIDNKKGRFPYEKELMKTDVDGSNIGLFITGPGSSGKSYPLIALCNEFVRGGKTCAFVEVRNFFEDLKSTLDNREQYSALMSKVKEADVLVLDNLGDEKISEWVRDDILSGILDYRSKNQLLTYITSSYTIEELVSLYNVSKTGASDVGRIKANKFVERILSVCPKQIVIEGK